MGRSHKFTLTHDYNSTSWLVTAIIKLVNQIGWPQSSAKKITAPPHVYRFLEKLGLIKKLEFIHNWHWWKIWQFQRQSAWNSMWAFIVTLLCQKLTGLDSFSLTFSSGSWVLFHDRSQTCVSFSILSCRSTVCKHMYHGVTGSSIFIGLYLKWFQACMRDCHIIADIRKYYWWSSITIFCDQWWANFTGTRRKYR